MSQVGTAGVANLQSKINNLKFQPSVVKGYPLIPYDKGTMVFMELLQRVEEKLRQVIDPETGMDVMRMKLVRDLEVNEAGAVELTFRPSSVLCPLGFQLGINIKEAVQSVPGVRSVHIRVDGFIHANQLRSILDEMDS